MLKDVFIILGSSILLILLCYAESFDRKLDNLKGYLELMWRRYRHLDKKDRK